jgi:hypothetical protein
MKYKRLSGGFLLRLVSGENVLEKLTEFCGKEKISAGVFFGIGALSKAELGHFSMQEKKYSNKTFEEELEVLGFAGNISLKEGKPFVHSHVVLGRKDFSCIGGHLISGVTGATLELFVFVFDSVLERKKDEGTELFLLDV